MKNFIDTIKSIFVSNPYEIVSLNKEYVFVYDDCVQKCTFMLSEDIHPDITMKIINHNFKEVSHVCIDGGLIKHGLSDYVGDGQPHGRNDCMVFSDEELLLIELKMDVSVESKDKTRWSRFSDAMHQISDFYLYLVEKMEEKDEPITTYYTISAIHPIISMKNQPRPSAQRNNEKEKFRLATKLKIETTTEYSI